MAADVTETLEATGLVVRNLQEGTGPAHTVTSVQRYALGASDRWKCNS